MLNLLTIMVQLLLKNLLRVAIDAEVKVPGVSQLLKQSDWAQIQDFK